MVPNENTFQGISNGSKPNLRSAAVMEKISKNATKPRVQCHVENYKTLKILAQFTYWFFLPQPISNSQETAENGAHWRQ